MDVAVAILVLVASGVALAIAWGAYRHRHTTPARLFTTLSLAIAPTEDIGNVKVFALTIANMGSTTATVGTASFEVMDAAPHIVPCDWFLQRPQPLPIVLGPGGEWNGLIRADLLRDAVADAADHDPPWQVRASVHDSIGHAHHSDWLTAEPEAAQNADAPQPSLPDRVDPSPSLSRPAATGRRADSVEVSFRLGTTSLGWTARQELLMRFRQLDSMADVVQAFAKAGRSEPVSLTPDQESKLLRAIENWSLLAGDALPEGIRDLGDALRDDLQRASGA